MATRSRVSDASNIPISMMTFWRARGLASVSPSFFA
jgi:hypothetical protein